MPTIMGEVRRHFRDRTWAVHVPRRLKELQVRIGPATEELSQRLGRVPNAHELAAELGVDLVEVTRTLVASNGYQANSIDAVSEDDRDTPTQPIMRFFENLTQSEIAERIGASQMQVSRFLARTLTSLRDQALAERAPAREVHA
ncbi:sigma-70 domain-containing protein [Nocardia fluminea]|uniref:sigma-70 domain-containing protein n=1 Tax=Nocardia fluminea TaxID=134984 RepID=UPI003669645D